MLYRDVYRTIFNKTENVEAKLDAMKPWQRFVKRTCDVVFALMGLILLSPVFLIVYLMLKI